jgi:hypothetical protein
MLLPEPDIHSVSDSGPNPHLAVINKDICKQGHPSNQVNQPTTACGDSWLISHSSGYMPGLQALQRSEFVFPGLMS